MFIYVLKATKQRFRYKIGISKNPRQRRKSVSKPNRLIFFVPLLGSFRFEQWLHRKYKHLNRPEKGNGGTEWFYFWLPFRPILWLILAFLGQIVVFLALLVLIVKVF